MGNCNPWMEEGVSKKAPILLQESNCEKEAVSLQGGASIVLMPWPSSRCNQEVSEEGLVC